MFVYTILISTNIIVFFFQCIPNDHHNVIYSILTQLYKTNPFQYLRNRIHLSGNILLITELPNVVRIHFNISSLPFTSLF